MGSGLAGLPPELELARAGSGSSSGSPPELGFFQTRSHRRSHHIVLVLLLTQPVLPTGITIVFRHCPHAYDKSKYAQIEWHYQPALSADGVDVRCNCKPRNTSGKRGHCQPLTLHTQYPKIRSDILHTTARCPPGSYGDCTALLFLFSFTHALGHCAP